MDSYFATLAADQASVVEGWDTFLSVVGNELRNPMTPMLGKVQRLRRSVHKGLIQPDEIEEGLRQIEWLLLRYIKQATTLLDVSRVKAGNLEFEPIATDICELVKDVVSNLSILAALSGSIVECVLPSEAVVGAWDPLALEQILDNLITNAIEYGESKPVEIALELQGRDVVIRVVDHGCGISTEDQGGLFDGLEISHFSNGANVGRGVGLWLIQRLTTAMGGSVAVSSAPLQGSVFTLVLPRNMTAGET